MILTRRYRFSASHRLHSPSLSDERNRDIYGKCNNPYGHGHNYILEVSVEGTPDPRSGRLMAVADLDDVVREKVLAVYDGKYMNRDVAVFTGSLVPTTENVAMDIRARLETEWPQPGETYRHTERMPRLAGVRLFETKKNIFDI